MKKILIALTLLLPMVVSGHDIEVPNEDGVLIYYYWKDDTHTALEVTHQWLSGDSWDPVYTGKIVIPESVHYNGNLYPVTAVGQQAFSGCDQLTEVVIPNSVTSFGGDAFSGCSGLKSVNIPKSVTTIYVGTFFGCSSLSSINVDPDNSKYDSRNNCNAIIETTSNTLFLGCQNTIIPNSVTSIGDFAFESCSGLTSVTIPNSVTSIGNGAFRDCI